jgi:hypothetical protein
MRENSAPVAPAAGTGSAALNGEPTEAEADARTAARWARGRAYSWRPRRVAGRRDGRSRTWWHAARSARGCRNAPAKHTSGPDARAAGRALASIRRGAQEQRRGRSAAHCPSGEAVGPPLRPATSRALNGPPQPQAPIRSARARDPVENLRLNVPRKLPSTTARIAPLSCRPVTIPSGAWAQPVTAVRPQHSRSGGSPADTHGGRQLRTRLDNRLAVRRRKSCVPASRPLRTRSCRIVRPAPLIPDGQHSLPVPSTFASATGIVLYTHGVARQPSGFMPRLPYQRCHINSAS